MWQRNGERFQSKQKQTHARTLFTSINNAAKENMKRDQNKIKSSKNNFSGFCLIVLMHAFVIIAIRKTVNNTNRIVGRCIFYTMSSLVRVYTNQKQREKNLLFELENKHVPVGFFYSAVARYDLFLGNEINSAVFVMWCRTNGCNEHGNQWIHTKNDRIKRKEKCERLRNSTPFARAFDRNIKAPKRKHVFFYSHLIELCVISSKNQRQWWFWNRDRIFFDIASLLWICSLLK